MDNETQPTDSDSGNTELAPYRVPASHLVASMVALATRVFDLRPEAQYLPGALALHVFSASGTIVLALDQGNGNAIIIEQIDADPQSPTFGASTLPIVTSTGPAH